MDVVSGRYGQRVYAEAKGSTSSPGLDIDTLYGQSAAVLGFITGSNVSVVPVVGLDANDEVVAARWAARQVDLDRTPLRWCYEGDVAGRVAAARRRSHTA